MNNPTTSSKLLSPNKPIYFIILGLSLVLTSYCLSSAFSRGVANAWYFSAEFSLNDWAKENIIKDKSDYKRTLNSIKKAQSLDPRHPHYAHMVGRIMHWGVDMGFENKASLAEVNEWYLLASQLRPLWPDPWVDLLKLNNSSHGYNDLTKHYLMQAIDKGPFSDFVTTGSVKILLLNWSILTGDELTLLFHQFDVATKKSEVLEKVFKFAQEINKDKILCSQLKFNPKYLNQKGSYIYKHYCLK
jgi:hypothetical protein